MYVDELRDLIAAAPTQASGCACCAQDRYRLHRWLGHGVKAPSSKAVQWEASPCAFRHPTVEARPGFAVWCGVPATPGAETP